MANLVSFSFDLFDDVYNRLNQNAGLGEAEVVEQILKENKFRRHFQTFQKQVQIAARNAFLAKREATKENSPFARYLIQIPEKAKMAKCWKEFRESQEIDSQSIMKKWTTHLHRKAASQSSKKKLLFEQNAQAWSLEDFAKLIKKQDIEQLKDQLLPFQIPDIDRAALLLYAHRREVKKTQIDRFIPASGVIPCDTYVNRDGKIFLRGMKMVDSSVLSGAVYECFQLGSDDLFVVKDVVACNPMSPYHELEAMESLQGGFGILPLISSSCYSNESVPRMALFMPKYDGSLDQIKDQLTSKQKQMAAVQIIQILKGVAEKGIHRDIGLKNFLIDKGAVRIKVFDFESFWFYGQKDGNQDLWGTCENYSPEYAKAYGFKEVAAATISKIDVWAAGMALIELFSGFKRKGQSQREIVDQITQLAPNWVEAIEEWNSIPFAWRLLIAQMTEVDPAKRLSALEVWERVEKMLSEGLLSD